MSFQQNLPVAVVGGDSIKWPLSHRLPTTRAQRRQGSGSGLSRAACEGVVSIMRGGLIEWRGAYFYFSNFSGNGAGIGCRI